jgi:hypothetical protein
MPVFRVEADIDLGLYRRKPARQQGVLFSKMFSGIFMQCHIAFGGHLNLHPTLSRGALALLLRMIGTPKQQVDAEDLSITSDFKELLSTGMIHPLQNSATSINVDDQDCELLPCPSGSGYRYFSPGAGWERASAQRGCGAHS